MRLVFLVPLLVFAAPASAEVASVADTGFVVTLSGEAQASKQEVWTTLTAPARWWSSDHTYSGNAANLYLDSQATGCFCEKLPRPKDAPEGQRIGSVEHMHIVYADPQAGILRMRGALGPLQGEALVGTLTITLKPGKVAGTQIAWTYVVGGFSRLKNEQIAPAVDRMLGEQFAGLLAKSVPPPGVDPVSPN
jgi:uncharacterized protein YndB with AHSA1/START domain